MPPPRLSQQSTPVHPSPAHSAGVSPSPPPPDHSHLSGHPRTQPYYDPRLMQPYPYPYPPYHLPSHPHPCPYPCPPAPPAGPSTTAPTPQDHNDPAPAKKRARTSTSGATRSRKSASIPVHESEDDDDGEDGAEVKRKKRLPLSCGECQRRKIKCDRKIPCSACVRRKRTDFCSFDDDDPVTPYALNSEVRSLSRRLTHLEGLFHQQPPRIFSSPAVYTAPLTQHPSPAASLSASAHSYASQPLPPPHPYSSHPSAQVPSPQNGATSLPAGDSVTVAEGNEEDLKQALSDTEDAVADLEEKTFGARVPVLQALHAAAQTNVKRYNYVKVIDMELTSALTSILAEPLSYDQDGRPRSAVRLGLDLAVSTGDLPSVRNEALAQIFAVLPDAEIATFLIRKYFTEMEWDFRVLDPVAFPVEHDRYVQMKEGGRQDLLDPLWIACLCMVLALSLEGFFSRPHGAKDLSLFRGLSEQDLKDLPSVWHDAALRALQLGEWGGTPRIRTIQCILLMQQYIQLSSSSGQQGRILGWISSAVRCAQRMGLHRLGSNPKTMPPDDPALPPGSNALKRETAVRLFNHLVNIDSWTSDSPSLRCYLLHPSQYNTARPLNLNQRELSRTDWRTPAPHPLTVYTDASFQLVQCKTAEQIRRALDELVLSDDAFSYAAVLVQDKAFRQVFEDVPEVFADRLVQIDSSRVAYERACLHEDVLSRLIRLNRPLLGRGYLPNSPYAYSTEQCISSAKKLILSNVSMLGLETSRWWVYTGTLASSIVLMMDSFHGIDNDASEKEIKENRDILLKARAIFDTQVATPALTVVVEEGRKILAALCVEEERRRTTKAAHSMASAPPPALESFAQVLKRVSREIAAREQPNPAALIQSATLPRPFSIPSLAPPHPPFSFAQAAASAMANTATTTTAFDIVPATLPTGSAPFEPDYSSFFDTIANSGDWAAGGLGSPGDEEGLLDQLAATW
ncbi:hypothetical protein JCM11641_001900 [Rhodosporidiobolus odoratus]